MTRVELLASIAVKLNLYLDTLERQDTPGSIVLELHSDGKSVRKVVVGLREAWAIDTP